MKSLHRTRPGRTFYVTAFALAAVLAASFVAREAHAAATLFVATNGVDSADCGPEGMPACRSISRAIAHASGGDEIVVGPGVYGDINRDGIANPAGDSGEESPVSIPELSCSIVSNVNLAMIHVDKPVTIVSRDGAGSTVIDAGGQFPANYIAVNLAADGAVLGKRGKGFTIRNGTIGVHVDAGISGADVQGNVAECSAGFVVGSCESFTGLAEGTTLKANTSAPDSMVGFYVLDESAVLSGNLAKGSLGYGFAVLGSADTTITKNLAVDGYGPGFLVSFATTAPAFRKNAAIGNLDAGLYVSGLGSVATSMTIEKNSFFGNGTRPHYPPANCGIVIQNSGAQMLTVNAGGNYWGAASGPGADPADTAGGTCSAGVISLNVPDWAETEIRVKPPTK